MGATDSPLDTPALHRALLRLLDRKARIEAGRTFLHELLDCFDTHGIDHDQEGATADLSIHVQPRPHPQKEARAWVTFDPSIDEVMAEAAPSCLTPFHLANILNNWAVASTSRYYAFHGGAVALGGHAAILPAASRSGKTTLTAALVQRGFHLLSDEVAALSMQARLVVPYPRKLWIRTDVLQTLGLPADAGVVSESGRQRIVSAAEPGSQVARSGATTALVVVPKFQAGARTRLERLRPGPAVVAMMDCSCSQRRSGEPGLDFVIALASTVPCYRLVFSRLDEAVERFVETFRQATGAES